MASIPLPLDNGFLRRQCPDCEREFKWHNGRTPSHPGTPDPAVYFCPYCAHTAPPDHWWTTEQLAYIEQVGLLEADKVMSEAFRGLEKKTKGGLFEIKVEKPGSPEPPAPLHEPTDMILVEPPCHPWEPLKILDDWGKPIHCVICGAAFAV